MAFSFIFLMILFSVTATKGEMRQERELHPDDKKTINRIQKELNDLKTSLQNRDCFTNSTIWMKKMGSVYTRWGRSDCPDKTELIYNGRAAGSNYNEEGGAANTLCLPMDPQWRYKVNGNQRPSAHIYGAEYETNFENSPYKENHNFEIPCAVCRTEGRPNVYMMPAWKKCKKGWRMEYSGYLMSDYHGHKSATDYLCMDMAPEKAGSKDDKNGRVFYAVEAQCGSLPCPPYIQGAELTCVVCSK